MIVSAAVEGEGCRSRNGSCRCRLLGRLADRRVDLASLIVGEVEAEEVELVTCVSSSSIDRDKLDIVDHIVAVEVVGHSRSQAVVVVVVDCNHILVDCPPDTVSWSYSTVRCSRSSTYGY